MQLNTKEIKKLAKQVHLQFTEEEFTRIKDDLNHIIDFMATIADADLSSEQADSHQPAHLYLRKDAEQTPLPQALVLAQAENDGQYFLVPKLISTGKSH